VWWALKYTGKQGELTVKALQKREAGLATSWDENAELITEVGFLNPLPGMKKKAREEGGETHLEIKEEQVKEAIYTQSIKKALGPDKINFKIISLVWKWDAKRIVALVGSTIRLGHHLKEWKIVTGVVIPKPGKPDYSQAKAYRVIALENSLGKSGRKSGSN
jgi:hypothetical protein